MEGSMMETPCAYCGDEWAICQCGRRASEQVKYGPQPSWAETQDRGIEAFFEELDKAEDVGAADPAPIRTFSSGATRNVDADKYDFEGFLSPLVLQEFAKYMHHHRVQADGNLRASDNWQKGMPLDVYMKSLLRHVMDLWLIHRGTIPVRPEDGKKVTTEDALGGIFFNVQGFWHEVLQDD